MRPVTDPSILAQLGSGQQQSAPQGMRPVEDPALLAQLNGGQNQGQQQAPQQESGPSPEQLDRARFVPSALGHTAANIMEAGRNFLNIPNQISPKTFGPLADPSRNYYNEMGVSQNTGDKVVGAVADFLPFMKGASLTKDAVMLAAKESPAIAAKVTQFAARNPKFAKFLGGAAENALSGAAYSAVQAPEGQKLSNAAVGGALGAATSVGSEALNALGRYGIKQYSQSAIPKFTEKATDKIRELLPSGDYAKNLADKYLSAVGANKANWKGLKQTAAELDKNVLIKAPEQRAADEVNKLGGKLFDKSQGEASPIAKSLHEVDSRYFNQSPYLDKIMQFQDKVKGLEPAMQVPYKQAMGVAENAAGMVPESFSGAVAARKNLNQEMKNYLSDGGKAINPANRESTQFMSDLKNTMKDDLVDANKDKVGAEALTGFKNQWEAANKSHQDYLKFNKSPQKMTGVEEEGKTVRDAFKASLPKKMGGQGIPLDGSIISKYMPSLTPKGAEGVEGFRQLSKLLGSKNEAREAAKSFIFKKQIGNGANTVDVAAQYAKLSDQQKKWLFGKSEEGKYLEAINNTRIAFNREPAKTAEGMGINRHLSGMGAPALLGFGSSYASGDSWDKSLFRGLEAGLGAKALGLVAGQMATPASVERAIAMKNAQPLTGRYANLAAQHLLNSQGNNR